MFVKGRSGNPGGRPKKTQAARMAEALAQETSNAAMERLKFWMASDDGRVSIAACNAILDRGLGKPMQDMTIEHTTHDLNGISDSQLAAILVEGPSSAGSTETQEDQEQLH